MTHNAIRKMVMLSLYAAIALALFVLEAQIPIPVAIPGVKLGLANVVTLLVLTQYRARDAFAVLVVRILLGSMFGGQMVGFLYSMAGGLCCFFAMWGCSRLLHRKQLWFTSVIGAVFHNIGQILAAVWVMCSIQVLAYFPFLLLSGCITGLFTGLAAGFLTSRMHPKSGKSSVSKWQK